MARKSRKSAAVEPFQMPAADRIYKAGLYARISVETERKREADTIGNQLQLLRDYVSEHSDLSVFDIYSDDDISGTDFIRPEFSRMMNDLRDGKINCIIVKDLSRLGRNYWSPESISKWYSHSFNAVSLQSQTDLTQNFNKQIYRFR